MTDESVTTRFFDRLAGLNVFGPIFSKELILASRRRWTYAWRTLYVLGLLVVMGHSWFFMYGLSFGPNRLVSNMGAFGLHLTVVITQFQLFALVFLAPILTGSAIGEEIRKQTLGCLLMTPITSLQIVTGKLFSRLFLLLMLVMVSFPLLAVVRVFGGVEWNLILAMEGLTMCSALFAAALSLTYSTFLKKNARDPVALTFFSLLTLYVFIPGLLTIVHETMDLFSSPLEYWMWFNPFYSATMITGEALDPGRGMTEGFAAPFVQCLLHLGATVLLVGISSYIIRKNAVRYVSGESFLELRRAKNRLKRSGTPVGRNASELVADRPLPSRWFKKLIDRPVLWQECHSASWAYPQKRNLLLGVSIAVLSVVYALFWDYLQEREVHILFVELFYLLILGRAASISASGVSREKEADTLELLLTTPLTPKTILWEKALATFPKVLPLIVPLVFHLLVFTVSLVISPFVALNILLILAGPFAFLVGMGIFFSVRSKDVRSAVLKSEGVALLLWAPCCPLASIFLYFIPVPVNPFLAVLNQLGDFSMEVRPMSFINNDPLMEWLLLPITAALYVLIGYLFFKWSVASFRRHTLGRGRN